MLLQDRVVIFSCDNLFRSDPLLYFYCCNYNIIQIRVKNFIERGEFEDSNLGIIMNNRLH